MIPLPPHLYSRCIDNVHPPVSDKSGGGNDGVDGGAVGGPLFETRGVVVWLARPLVEVTTLRRWCRWWRRYRPLV